MRSSRFLVSGFRFPVSGLAWLALPVAVLAAQLAAGDAPQVTAQLGANEIYFGEAVDYHVTLRNVAAPKAPDLAGFAVDFDVAAVGDQSLNQSSVFIVNGRMTRQEVLGHLFAYRLTPKKAGTLTVPAPVAVADGRSIGGPALSLRVIAPEKQDLVVMEIVTKPAQVYPTQSFEVTLRVFVKPLPDVKNRDPLLPLCQARQAPALQINWDNAPEGLSAEDRNAWLQKYLGGQQGFSINGTTAHSNDPFAFIQGPRVALFNLSAGRETRTALDGSQIQYFVYELKRTFTPKQAGLYRFGPATLKGQFVDGLATNRRSQYTARQLFVVAPARTVEVRPVPAKRPAAFCGGVGKYKVTASASPPSLRIGDPLTLTLAFEALPGSGSLDLISAPDLSANAALAECFDIIDKAPTGETKGGVKRFAYGLRARKAAPGIPPLTAAVFDPETGSFTELTTPPVKLALTETAQLNAGELVGTLPGSQPYELRSRQEGLFQNVGDVAELGDQRVRPLFCLAAVAAMWLFYGALNLLVANWRRKAGDVAWQRRQHALPDARRQLAEARAAAQAGRKEDALRAVRAALVGLLADMRNRPAAGMTSQEAAVELRSAGVAAETAAQAVRVLESIEALEYGSAALDAEALQATVEELLPRLQKELGARR